MSDSNDQDDTAETGYGVKELRAYFEDIDDALAPMMSVPADNLPAMLCEPGNRHLILGLRKSVAMARDFAKIAIEKAERLQGRLDAAQAALDTQQAIIEKQSERIAELEGPQDV